MSFRLLGILCVLLFVAQLTNGDGAFNNANDVNPFKGHQERGLAFNEKLKHAEENTPDNITPTMTTSINVTETPDTNATTTTTEGPTGETTKGPTLKTTAKPASPSTSGFQMTILNYVLMGLIGVILLVDIVLAVVKCKK
ncbi:hypothetical protein niasHS_017011 [Heterodera schachtii]|uniref:Uncharacterized protein n=1 Tax=Heterodera schachtii TaxID=97005 RepID=A0ABD2I0J5_HETSC